jgi:quinolinate synthase
MSTTTMILKYRVRCYVNQYCYVKHRALLGNYCTICEFVRVFSWLSRQTRVLLVPFIGGNVKHKSESRLI